MHDHYRQGTQLQELPSVVPCTVNGCPLEVEQWKGDGLIPTSQGPLRWPEREGSLPPTGSERLKGPVPKRHKIPGVLRTVGGDDPALPAEGGGRARVRAELSKIWSHLVCSLTTACKDPAAISRRSPGLEPVLCKSAALASGDSSFFRGEFSVPSSLSCTRLSCAGA